MNIDLPIEIETYINSQLNTGFYKNAVDVICAALQRMAEQDRYTQLQTAIKIGHEQLLRGEVLPYSENLIAQLTENALATSTKNSTFKENASIQ